MTNSTQYSDYVIHFLYYDKESNALKSTKKKKMFLECLKQEEHDDFWLIATIRQSPFFDVFVDKNDIYVVINEKINGSLQIYSPMFAEIKDKEIIGLGQLTKKNPLLRKEWILPTKKHSKQKNHTPESLYRNALKVVEDIGNTKSKDKKIHKGILFYYEIFTPGLFSMPIMPAEYNNYKINFLDLVSKPNYHGENTLYEYMSKFIEANYGNKEYLECIKNEPVGVKIKNIIASIDLDNIINNCNKKPLEKLMINHNCIYLLPLSVKYIDCLHKNISST